MTKTTRIFLIAITAIILFLALCASGNAQQGTVDHWSTSAEAVAATTAPFYYPSVRTQRKLGANEVVRGIPEDSAVEMDLPDRLGGRGFVKIEAGRPFVYDKTYGLVLRLYECNNKVYSVTPLPTIARQEVVREGSNSRAEARAEVTVRSLPGPEGPQGPGCRTEDAKLASGETVHLVICGRGENTTTTAIRDGEKGDKGDRGPRGKDGFCNGKPCKIAVGTVVVAGAVTTAACIFGWGGLCRASRIVGRGPGRITY